MALAAAAVPGFWRRSYGKLAPIRFPIVFAQPDTRALGFNSRRWHSDRCDGSGGRGRVVFYPRHRARPDAIHPIASGKRGILRSKPGSSGLGKRLCRVCLHGSSCAPFFHGGWMFSMFEHHPHFGIIILLLFILFEAILFTCAAVIFPSLMGALGSLAVASGNLFAAIAMFWFLIRRHPSAIAQLRLAWHED